ncbi:MAG: Molybdenum cofactor guanylyltransferase, partial [Verrucomicrobiales bacterium]|nr:Molybdenum cofactor guanylyltransferase [Verrucomicrobiales bacterium]
PLGGIYTGLKTSRADVILFLACDMPWVSVQLLRRVARAISLKTEAVFTKQNRFAGFPFALRVTALAQVERQIGTGDFSLQTLARNLQGKFVRAKMSELVDLDTPDDLAQARRRLKLVVRKS